MLRITILFCVLLTLMVGNTSAQDAENLERLSQFYPERGFPWDVEVVNDIAYVAVDGTGMDVLNVSDPENPELIGHWEDWRGAKSIAISGEYAYLAMEDDDDGGLSIVSIADPTRPVEVGRFITHGYANGILVSGEYAYLSDGGNGLRILSIADPENAEEIGSIDVGGSIYEIAISGDYAFAASSNPNGLRVISIADPENPEEVTYIETESHGYGITISGEHVFLANSGNGLRIFSIADPEHPEEVGRIDTPAIAMGVVVSGDHAFVASAQGGLRVISIVDPDNPTEVGHHLPWGGTGPVNVTVSDDNLIYTAEFEHSCIYRLTLPEGVSDANGLAPLLFSLSSAYPNPFNGQLSFSLSLPQTDIVRLHLYDVTGREVWSLSERFSVGVHRKSVNVNVESAGVYFLQAESTFGNDVQRVVMLK